MVHTDSPKPAKTAETTIAWDMFRLYAQQQHGGYGSIPSFVAAATGLKMMNQNPLPSAPRGEMKARFRPLSHKI
jgi:hypothetical protein